MKQVVLDLDVVEEEVLKRLLDMGLFESPQEAFKIALLKYGMDLGIMGDMKGSITIKNMPDLDRLALKAAPEDIDESDDSSDPQDPEDIDESDDSVNTQESDLEEEKKEDGSKAAGDE
jgi:hypothetical protein